jgi:hypothetical protein
MVSDCGETGGNQIFAHSAELLRVAREDSMVKGPYDIERNLACARPVLHLCRP